MKRRDLEKYLRQNGCAFHHQGTKHEFWYNKATQIVVPIPRHAEIATGTVMAICRELQIARPSKR